MRLQDIINILEKSFPTRYAYDWDNVGLLVGNNKSDIKKIQISLDATTENIDFAINNGVDLIITHHPIIFKGIKNINTTTPLGKNLLTLIQNNINVYSMHTNLDASGLNEYVAKKIAMGICDKKIIEEIDEGVGIGRIFKPNVNITVREYAEKIKKIFDLESIRVISSNLDEKVKKVAVVNGSGMSYFRDAKTLGANLLITGDVGYHDGLDAQEHHLNIFDMGHYESEICFSEVILDKLSGLEIECIVHNGKPLFKNI